MTPEQDLEKIENAINGSICMMHSRDIPAARDAVRAYVGETDMAYEAGARTKNFQLNSIFWAHANPEVPLALTVAQFELCGGTLPALRKDYWDKLQDPAMRERITTRFPAMSAERIARAVERVRPLVASPAPQ